MVNHKEILQKLLDAVAQENKYENCCVEIQPISSGGANYSSALFVAKISAPQRETIELFAKVANIPDETREMSKVRQAFNEECYFYTELVEIFDKLQDKHGVPKEHRLVLSKYYGSVTKEKEETIVLENLIAKGYKLYDRMKPLSWEYASKAVEVLAKFHALSFAYAHESPDRFKEIQHINVKVVSGDVGKHTFMNQMFTAAYDVLRDENKERVKKYFFDEDRYEELMDFYKPGRRTVLAHGDYRASNLMWKYQNGKSEVIPLDFQTVHLGCPVNDLLYFIYLGSDAEFRRLYYNNLIEHYYKELTLALQRLHVDIEDVYPRGDFESDLNALKMIGLLLGLSYLAVVTIDEADAPEFTPNMEVKPSDVYRRRVNEIVDEYIEKGLLK